MAEIPNSCDPLLAPNWLNWIQTLDLTNHLEHGSLTKPELILSSLIKLRDVVCPCSYVNPQAHLVTSFINQRQKKIKGVFAGGIMVAQLYDNRGVSLYHFFRIKKYFFEKEQKNI